MEMLPCAHAFHQECLDEYSKTIGIARQKLKCPLCKMTPEDLAVRESQLVDTLVDPDGLIIEADYHSVVPPHLAHRMPPPPSASTSSAAGAAGSGSATQEQPVDVGGSGPADPPPTLIETPAAATDEQTAAATDEQIAEVPPAAIGGSGSADPPPGEANAEVFAIVPASPAPSAIVPASPAPSNVSGLVQLAELAQGGVAFGCCHFCGEEVAPNEGKIVARVPTIRIQCRRCKRVDQCIGRSFGTIQFVRDMRYDKARQFYKSAAKMAPQQIKKLCEHETTFQEIETHTMAESGEFLPLAVWQSRGFDADRIKNNTAPHDCKFKPQIGWCYRVAIESDSRTVTQSQTEILKIIQSKRRRPAKARA